MCFFSVISAAYLYSTHITMEVTVVGESFCVFKLGLAMRRFLLMRIDAHQMRIDAHIPHH